MFKILIIKVLAISISAALCAYAPDTLAHETHKAVIDCYVKDAQSNYAVCVNSRTLQACVAVNDDNTSHVKHGRAIIAQWQVYLKGSNMPIGDISGTYNISSYDGLAWYAGECNLGS